MNETALKERIKAIAQEKGKTFNEIWKQLLLERFLARLAHSSHQSHFVFKGGLLLSQRILIGRETTDIDLLAQRILAEAAVLESAFREIVEVDPGDGFRFSMSGIIALAQPHLDYPGFRLTLSAELGKMKDRIQVDIGSGDAVTPVEDHFHPFEYRGKPIFSGEITLLCYPIETQFAEKLEACISKGAANSRMKDYHDLLLMIREPGLISPGKLKDSLKATFARRETALALPLMVSEEQLTAMQVIWHAHLTKLGALGSALGLHAQLRDVIVEINGWLGNAGI